MIAVAAVVAVDLVTLPSGVVWAILSAMAASVLVVLFADQRHRGVTTRRETRRNPRAAL